MTEKTVFSGRVVYRQICDAEGNLDESLLDVEITDEFLLKLFRYMKFARLFDQKALNLQRQGRLGTYAPLKGQEAAQVGGALAMEEEDSLFPSYREMAVSLVRQVPLRNILLYWGGEEEGNTGLRERGIFPVSIPVGSHPIHAVGAVRAKMIQQQHPLAVAYFGDGATSEGDLMEALNFAGVWNTPLLFFCQNNQWAISVPRSQQTASQTIAQKALAFGYEGVQIDGNDPLIVYQTVKQLRERALEESTPFLIEAVTYRMGDHTTADDSRRYRSAEEIEAWKKRDPLVRTRRLLEERELWNEEEEQELENQLQEHIREEIEAYEKSSESDPLDMFRYTYEEMTPPLAEQYRMLDRELNDE